MHYRVSTRNHVSKTRRRAGFEFSRAPRIVDVSGDAEKELLADGDAEHGGLHVVRLSDAEVAALLAERPEASADVPSHIVEAMHELREENALLQTKVEQLEAELAIARGEAVDETESADVTDNFDTSDAPSDGRPQRLRRNKGR